MAIRTTSVARFVTCAHLNLGLRLRHPWNIRHECERDGTRPWERVRLRQTADTERDDSATVQYHRSRSQSRPHMASTRLPGEVERNLTRARRQ